MSGFANLRLSVCIAAASGKKHAFILESDIIYNRKLIVGYRLLKSPKEIICRSHQQRAVFCRVFFVSAQRRVVIFLRDTVKPFKKGFYPRGQGPEV